MTISPGRRAWVEAMVARLAPRAAAFRDQPERGPANVAHVLASIVSRFEAELAAGSAAALPAVDGEAAKLERSLAAIQPRPGPYGLVINGGDIMNRVRHQLACRLATLVREPCPPPTLRADPIATELPPVAEALPFMAGPQLSLFELAP